MRGIARAALAALAGCSQVLGFHDVSVNDAGVDVASDHGMSYESTNTRGEFARWNVDGAALEGTWEITDTAGTLVKTLTISATCGVPDASYGSRSCTVTAAMCTGSCAADDAPPAGAIYTTLELPGVALVIAGAQGTHTVLHIGFGPDTDCPVPGASMSDYVSAYVGIAHPQLYGISRVTAGFNPFIHANFRMGPGTCSSSTPTGSCMATPQVIDIDATNGTDTLTSWDCTSGIQAVRLGSGPLRVMRSRTGVSITAVPEFAGVVSFPMPQAAAISDFASKTLVGMLVSDSGPPISAIATTGPVSSAAVPIASIQFSLSTLPFIVQPVIKPAANASSTLTSPAYPDFTTAPLGSYMSNTVLQPVYPTISAIPGLFVVDGMSAPNHSRLILAAGKQNGKLVGIGASYDWVNDTPGSGPSGNFSMSSLVLIEKP